MGCLFQLVFQGFQCYQTSKIVSLQNTIFKLTEANKWKKTRWLLRPLSPSPCSRSFYRDAWLPSLCSEPTPHLSLSVLCCLHLLYNFCFFIPVLSPNFPFFPLNLSPLPPLLNLLDLPFKVKSSENSNKPQVFYVPWTKAELWDIIKEIPKVTKAHTLSKGLLKNLTLLSNFPTYFCLFVFSDLCLLLYMLVGDSLTKHWMKFAQWELLERDLEKQTPNFWREARAFSQEIDPALRVAFLKPIDWNKIQVSSQKSNEPSYNYYNQPGFFRENSHLPSDVESAWVAFSSMFVDMLNWHLSFEAKRTRV